MPNHERLLIGGHAIELSFNPPYFRDPNDIDLKTLEPVKRTFATAELMLQALSKLYPPSIFTSFNLLSFETTKPVQQSDALAGIGVFLLKYPQEFAPILAHLEKGLGPEGMAPLSIRATLLINPLIVQIIKHMTSQKLAALKSEHANARTNYEKIHEEITQVKRLSETTQKPEERAELVQKWELLWEKAETARSYLERTETTLTTFKHDIPLSLS